MSSDLRRIEAELALGRIPPENMSRVARDALEVPKSVEGVTRSFTRINR